MLIEELITVVVPAYNASRTIDDTLKSIRSQTHKNLEIFVIDDGSTDRTSDIVVTHAKIDHRVKLLRQANAGVAAARNAGIASATGIFIAPIDADDVWAPDKIERQLEVFRGGDSRLGLVYTWSVPIDIDGRIIGPCDKPQFSGDVLREICRANFVGNGSAALIRTVAFEGTGCYDSSLRSAGAEGCEDISMYIIIAENWHFGVIPEPLTGYRQLAGSMSSDGLKMFRSWLLVAKEAKLRNPSCKDDLAIFTSWMMSHYIRQDRRARRYGRVMEFVVHYPVRVSQWLLLSIIRKFLYFTIGDHRHRSGSVDATEARRIGGLFTIGDPPMPPNT